MSADLVIAGYVYIAKQDLDGARLLNRDENRNVAYLCEQAAEKLIRAVLTSEGIQAGIRHELPDILAGRSPTTAGERPLVRPCRIAGMTLTGVDFAGPGDEP